jgi:DNA mismatch endonuclease, patch repair protein
MRSSHKNDHARELRRPLARLRIKPSSIGVRRGMQKTRQRDTAIERRLRSQLHRLGLRFRLHVRVNPASTRTADLVFPKARVAVFVDSCFWHSCPAHGTLPKTNRTWWRHKLAANRARDQDTVISLRDRGWVTIRVWEHQSFERAAARIARVVAARMASAIK